MTASNKMELFYGKMHKLNSQRIGWLAIWITALAGIPLCTLNSDGNDLGLFYTIVALLLFMMASISYVKKYTELDQDDTTEPSLTAMTGSSARFANFMLVHSFDTFAYFRILMLRFIPVQAISAILIILLGVFKLTENMPVMLAIVIIVPLVVICLSALSFRHSLSHEYGLLHRFMRGTVAYIYTIVSFIGYEIYLASLVLIIVAIVYDKKVMEGLADTEIARISSGADIWLIIGGIATMVFGYCLNNTMAEKKKGRLIRLAFLLVSALTAVAGVVLYITLSFGNNVLIREDSFVLSRSGVKTEYELDDVKSYRIYSGKDGIIRMELHFNDGKSADLFTGSSSDTDAWRDKYFSDYNYAAELAGKLDAAGIKGTLEDRDKLYKNVTTSLDPRCAEGFRAIEAVMK